MALITSREAVQKILEARYFARDEEGRVIETVDDMFRRIASAVADAEKKFNPDEEVKKWEEKFLRIIRELKFLPNSPTIMNAGRPIGQLAACFVLPVEDSLESIFETVKRAAIIHQSGGGTGFSFSRLRPKGDIVSTTGGNASGVVSFIEVFNAATEAIKQGGTRRGANMAVLRVDHPDIVEFIQAKDDRKRLNAFNISVGVTDEFMRAFENDSKYAIINPKNGKTIDHYSASKVLELIAKSAWMTGEPGILFLDRINRGNPTPELGEIEATNPCGEQPLLANEACTLGSLDLKKFVTNNKIDWNELGDTVETAVRFLDDVVEINRYPFKENEIICRAHRKIGLGVMGFAHMLVRLGIPYDSEDALNIAEEVIGFISRASVHASEKIAQERGAFSNFNRSIFSRNKNLPRRNATLTTVAPTGTISMIAGTSSGIEPIFSLAYTRRVVDTEMFHVDEAFQEALGEHNSVAESVMGWVRENGRIKGQKWIPERLRSLFPTAHDIPAEWHLRIQEVFQRHVENAVSKTVNLPAESRPEDVLRLYTLAFKSDVIKGVTVYRDGTREGQVLCIGCGPRVIT